MNPFELAFGVEVKQPMDLTIPKTRGNYSEGTRRLK